MESEEIGQAMNHLRLMDNLADDLSLLACLRGPAVGMDERELAAVRLRHAGGSYLEAMQAAALEDGALARRCAGALDTLAHERFLLAEMPLDKYLWGWVNRSGLYAFYGCQPGGKLRQANLRMLCQKAGEHVKQRGGDLRDFLNATAAQEGVRGGDSPTVLSPREDVVRVMTIHKSKGLEFPVVFVMGLEGSLNRRQNSALTMHPRLGVALPYVNEEARTKGDTLLGGAVALRAQAEERAERARLLYVAMTRARDELILLGSDEQLTQEALAAVPAGAAEGSAYAVGNAGSMLAWICQCLNESDFAEYWQPDAVSNNPAWINLPDTVFSTQSTTYPQKRPGWRLVFHTEEEETRAALACARGETAAAALEQRTQRLAALTGEARKHADAAGAPPQEGAAQTGGDPVAPKLAFTRHPFKVGVTALVYADREALAAVPVEPETAEGDAAQAESAEQKRLPLPLTRPKLMDDLPSMPAFIRPPAEQTGLMRGVATHKVLSLLIYEGLRGALGNEEALHAEVERQLDALCARRLLTAQERGLVDTRAVARFFQSPCGSGALAARTVHREWSFNLALPERDGLIVQGIIDLCYLERGAWRLADYKTDRVAAADELWALYGEQIALYRRALAEATGLPVREATLFSLPLGEGSAR